MPSEKSLRSSIRKQKRNRSVRSATRTFVSTAQKAIRAGDDPSAEAAVKRAVKALDTSAKRGILHANNAARRKSRLMKRFNALSPKS